MTGLGALVFLNGWVLAGLLALPVLWWLLRAIPPSPQVRVFAGVRLLLGLEDEERQTDKTPWWLLALRMAALGAAIIGFAQPVLNPSERVAPGGGPLLVLMDQGWASAPDWPARQAAAEAVLDEAADAGRQVLFWRAAEDDAPGLMPAGEARRLLGSTRPAPWAPDHAGVLASLQDGTLAPDATIWIHDGMAHGAATGDLRTALAGTGSLRLIGPEALALGLTPPRLDQGQLSADVLRADPSQPAARVVAFARSPEGGERRIAIAEARFEDGAGRATATFNLPTELLGQVTRLVLADRPSAGGASFADGAIRRISAVVVAPENEGNIASLTSPTHYLVNAIAPWADIQRTSLAEAVAAEPAAVFLIDYGTMTPETERALTEYIEAGGLLVRFAGPRLAAAISEGRYAAGASDPLLPVRLRRGGRVLGGALAWSAPRTVGAFAEDSPFRGLTPPEEVAVRTQVLAEPLPELAGRVWATLDDGTPLVTARQIGDGRLVLFHVTSDAEWSSLPLSGLFVEMLGRLSALASDRNAGLPSAEDLAGTLWRADLVMGGNGTPEPASDLQDPVPGERFVEGGAARDLPPGIYSRANRQAAGAGDSIVVNLMGPDAALSPAPAAPVSAVTETLGSADPVRYGPWLIAVALVLVALDVLATLVVSGRLALAGRAAAAGCALLLIVPDPALAQTAPEDRLAVGATAETTLGFVLTGNDRLDRLSERAITGLGDALRRRTAVEPGPPVGVDPASDEMAFYPVLYWPLSGDTVPPPAGLEALARYLVGGGLLIIDTQNGASGFGGASNMQMREIARALNLPPLAPVGDDHVLSRTFYLLSSYPGRWRGGRVWAEAPPSVAAGQTDAEDIPKFDRIDDNVSPVIVGSADWASAWAIDERGYPLFAVGRPGDRQREMAIRFGVNAVMYALTGNYKSDQVHAPAVLQRLGQ